MALPQTYAITNDDFFLIQTNTVGGREESFNLEDLKSITPEVQIPAPSNTYQFTDMLRLILEFSGETRAGKLIIELNNVTNQVGWTKDLPGMIVAMADIRSWAKLGAGAAGLATEVTLAALLTELQLKADLSETQPVSLPTGVAVLTQATVVAGGSVAAGTTKAYFQNIGTTDAVVLGSALEPGISIPFEAPEGKTNPAIAYTASATAILKIVTVT